MTREELLTLLIHPFRANFAEEQGRRVLEADAVALLYEMATDPPASLARVLRERVAFRAAYILEWLFFVKPECFTPYRQRFCCEDFPVCAYAGARRHFAKMMARLLPEMALEAAAVERIAEAAAQWAVDPATRVAVRIWCVEILKQCRTRCDWVEELWEDLLVTLDNTHSPAIAARMRNGWRTAQP